MRLVLASASARRAELLSAAGIAFTVQPVDADESLRDGEPPDAYVRRVAVAKAAAAAARPPDGGTIILTADTTVAIDGLILGKPRDDRDALAMLARLAGRTHRVLTAIVLSHTHAGAWRQVEDLAVTEVTFHSLTADAIAWYVASGEPRDRAGAYAVQGLASRFVARLDGSYSNVVGLPIDLVCRHLETLAPDLLADAVAARPAN